MGENFKDWLETLKSRIDIVTVVSQYTKLFQKGGSYWACCPFHHEKEPSFCVNPSKNNYFCFGACKEGGDAIAFIQKIEKTDFMGALKILAGMVGMEMPDFNPNSAGSAINKSKLYDLMKEAGIYYFNNLQSDDGKVARDYLEKRGITDDTIRVFGMGYSSNNNGVVKHLQSLGYTIEEMQEVGLVSKNSTRGYDLFSERIIVPIFNGTKQVVGFGGRVLEKKDKFGKYFNTPTTVLFNKRVELFGQHSIKKLQLTESVNSIIVVEGYMDAISLYQAGVKNVMATMGTALTTQHARILKRYSSNINLCYDGDDAGQKGSFLGVDRLLEEDLSVKVTVLPDGADPDEYIRKYGKDEYLKLVSHGYAANEFKIRYMAKSYDLTDDMQVEEFAKKAVEMISNLTPIQAEKTIPVVVKLSKLPESVIRGQLYHDRKIDVKAIRKQEKVSEKNNAYYLAARFILFALYSKVDECKPNEDISVYFDDDEHRQLYDYIRQCEALGEDYSLNTLMMMDNNTEANEVEKASRMVTEDEYAGYFKDCLAKLKRLWRQKKLLELSKDFDSNQSEADRLETLTRIMQVKNIKDEGKKGE